MPPTIDLFYAFLIFFSVYTKCCSNFQIQSLDSSKKNGLDEAGNVKPIDKAINVESSINFDNSSQQENGKNQNNNKVLPISINNHPDSSLKKNRPLNSDSPTKGRSEFVFEGGSVPQDTSALPEIEQVEMMTDDNNHSKGSKGRKGVQYSSSVVPRKGVQENTPLKSNNTLIPETTAQNVPVTDSSNLNSTEKTMSLNSGGILSQEHIISHEQTTQKITHAKKPEVVSDLRDVDEFDKYAIIKTSTTGEDYVIIGIVIVIGIWFSVFGALIFYRRAGEYWDRRHYRRMDFLVEGMYND